MKLILGIFLLFSFNLQAKVYDSFICYTQTDMAVIHGVLSPLPTVDIHHHRLKKNPTRFQLDVNFFNRLTGEISAVIDNGNDEILQLEVKNLQGIVNLNLNDYAKRDLVMQDEPVLCYLGYFEE